MKLIKIAASQLGVEEILGDKDNPQIVKYARETGIANIDNDEIPWCSTFINWCAKKAGLQMSGKPNARSWINVGTPVKNPKPGDLVVFWRGTPHSWQGHVGIFTGFNSDASSVFCLGGNQSNTVSIAEYSAARVLGYRRIGAAQQLRVPESRLKRGSKGREVMKLQMILNHLDYNCGDPDGDFGPKTENALKILQADNRLQVDGLYYKEVRNCIESLLQS